MWPNIRKAHTKSKEERTVMMEHGVEQAIQEKKEALKCVEEVSDAEKTKLKQMYWEKKNAANKAVAKARYKKQQEWCDGEVFQETTKPRGKCDVEIPHYVRR